MDQACSKEIHKIQLVLADVKAKLEVLRIDSPYSEVGNVPHAAYGQRNIELGLFYGGGVWERPYASAPARCIVVLRIESFHVCLL